MDLSLVASDALSVSSSTVQSSSTEYGYSKMLLRRNETLYPKLQGQIQNQTYFILLYQINTWSRLRNRDQEHQHPPIPTPLNALTNSEPPQSKTKAFYCLYQVEHPGVRGAHIKQLLLCSVRNGVNWAPSGHEVGGIDLLKGHLYTNEFCLGNVLDQGWEKYGTDISSNIALYQFSLHRVEKYCNISIDSY
jgi:hypothetical protein